MRRLKRVHSPSMAGRIQQHVRSICALWPIPLPSRISFIFCQWCHQSISIKWGVISIFGWSHYWRSLLIYRRLGFPQLQLSGIAHLGNKLLWKKCSDEYPCIAQVRCPSHVMNLVLKNVLKRASDAITVVNQYVLAGRVTGDEAAEDVEDLEQPVQFLDFDAEEIL